MNQENEEEKMYQSWKKYYRKIHTSTFFIQDTWTININPLEELVDNRVLQLPYWILNKYISDEIKSDHDLLDMDWRLINMYFLTAIRMDRLRYSSNQDENDSQKIVLLNFLFQEARKELFPVLSKSFQSVRYFDLYIEEFFMGRLWRARQNWEEKSDFYDESFCFIGLPYSLLKIVPALILSNQNMEYEIQPIVSILEVLMVAMGLEREILYWKIDFTSGYISWVTASFLKLGNQKFNLSMTSMDDKEFNHFFSQIIESDGYIDCINECRKRALQFYHEALSSSEELGIPDLDNFIQNRIERLNQESNELLKIW